MAIDPNMGFLLPTDHGDAETWGVILDTALTTIGAHNHSAGSGAKISISQLAFDADISFVDSGGGKHAITDLKAIDFFPVPASDVTALAGAFFLNNADNELYFRNLSGANIKFTNGATLNSAAFVGGIGGDYQAVAALEIFDDATDAYWFQQQVGTGVRQYAKMRCADLALFEFKTVAAGPPVPVLAVTLKSPAALAAGYTLTMPAALPSTKSVLAFDTAGVGTLYPVGPIVYPITNAVPQTPAAFSPAIAIPTSGTTFTPVLNIGNAGTGSACPITLPIGATITAWSTAWNKASNATGTISAALVDCSNAAGTNALIGAVQTNSANAPGAVALGQSGLSTVVTAGHTYHVVVWGNANTNPDTVQSYQVTPT